jgi:hypothetical protein
MANSLTSRPLLVFEEQGLLVPYDYIDNRGSEVLVEDLSKVRNLVRDTTQEPYRKDLFQIVSEGPSAHLPLVMDTCRVIRKIVALRSGNTPTEQVSDEHYISDIFSSSRSDAIGVRQRVFETVSPSTTDILSGTWVANEAQGKALTLYTPHLREEDGMLLTRVFISKADIRENANNLPLPDVVSDTTYEIRL